MDIERKSLRVELKQDSPGEFEAVFSTFNAVDADGDVTLPGAFKAGAEVIVGAWNHSFQGLPTGRARIEADNREARVAGRFLLDTEAGEQTYKTVKALGELQEWSYLYSIGEASFGEFEGRDVRFLKQIEVHSVDPVLIGAGVDTRTTAIKSSQAKSFGEHGEAVLAGVSEFAERAAARAAMRSKEGRHLSADDRGRVEELVVQLDGVKARLEEALEVQDEEGSKALAHAYLAYQRTRARLAGALPLEVTA